MAGPVFKSGPARVTRLDRVLRELSLNEPPRSRAFFKVTSHLLGLARLPTLKILSLTGSGASESQRPSSLWTERDLTLRRLGEDGLQYIDNWSHWLDFNDSTLRITWGGDRLHRIVATRRAKLCPTPRLGARLGAKIDR